MAQLTSEPIVQHLRTLHLGGYIVCIGENSHDGDDLAAELSTKGFRVAYSDIVDPGQISLILIGNDISSKILDMLQRILESGARPLVLLMGKGQKNDSLPESIIKVLVNNGYLFPAVNIREAGLLEFRHPEYQYKKHFDLGAYWEQRYAAQRDSGSGSYGRLANYKAHFLNELIRHEAIESIVDFGCGDGNQATLLHIPRYIGLDISESVIEQCRNRFELDSSKEFEVYYPDQFDPAPYKAEMCISLDVIYHLSDDKIYEQYLEHLFRSATRFVVIYANTDSFTPEGVDESSCYIRFRDFLSDVAARFSQWQLIGAEPNRYPYSRMMPNRTSFADFYVFAPTGSSTQIGFEQSTSDFRQLKALRMLSVQDENLAEIGANVKNTGQTARAVRDTVSGLTRDVARIGEHTDRIGDIEIVFRQVKSQLATLSESLERSSSDIRNEVASGCRQTASDLGSLVETVKEQFSTLQEALQEEQARYKSSIARVGNDLEKVTRVTESVPLIEKEIHDQRQSEPPQLSLEVFLDKRLAAFQAAIVAEKRPPKAHSAPEGNADRALEELRRSASSLERNVRALIKRRNALEDSVSFRFGKALIDAVIKPGLNTLALPKRLYAALRREAGSREIVEPVDKELRKCREAIEQLQCATAGQSGESQLRAPERIWHKKISLTSEFTWFCVNVVPGLAVNIQGMLRAEGGKQGIDQKSVVVVIECIDGSGSPIKNPVSGLAYSERLSSYFKYVPVSEEIHPIHGFIPPSGTRRVLVGFRTFHAPAGRRYVFDWISVTAGAASHSQLLTGQPELRDENSNDQERSFEIPSREAMELSILGWPEQPPNGKPYVIGIMDEFTAGCFEQDVNLIQPRPDNWYALAEKYPPAFFFIESAWKGNYGSWQYRVAHYAHKPGPEVAHICQYARQKGIPTVFWNKEDPVHHEKFMCSAGLADHIFTTDANMKDSYRARTGNRNVHGLPFAAQPALHKPAPLAGRKPRACFAGSWYGNRHAERGEAMRWLLQVANRHGLDIYDRNHGTGIFPFPEEYKAGIKGSLPYKELCEEYARYRIFLNVNSVTDSPTMFSRRVFELMACGTPVVSTYAKGIENLFESDAVWLVNSREEADEAIQILMNDDTEWRRRSLAGIREVFARHTYAHRLNDIFDRLGVETSIPTDPAIALVADAHNQAELEALHHFARKQSYRSFQLGIACVPGLAQVAGSLSDNITLLQRRQKGPWLAEQTADTVLAGWLSPHDHYGEHYLRDLANASVYEPEALGWAKGLQYDYFAYNQKAALHAALWKIGVFLDHWCHANHQKYIRQEDLFVIDGCQYRCGVINAIGG